MLIKWTFANGDTSEIEVSEEIAAIVIDSRKAEHAQQEKERYHCYSLDAIDYEGDEFRIVRCPFRPGRDFISSPGIMNRLMCFAVRI